MADSITPSWRFNSAISVSNVPSWDTRSERFDSASPTRPARRVCLLINHLSELGVDFGMPKA